VNDLQYSAEYGSVVISEILTGKCTFYSIVFVTFATAGGRCGFECRLSVFEQDNSKGFGWIFKKLKRIDSAWTRKELD